MFTKPPLVYSNCFIREEIYGGKVKFYFNKKALREKEEEILKVLILYFLLSNHQRETFTGDWERGDDRTDVVLNFDEKKTENFVIMRRKFQIGAVTDTSGHYDARGNSLESPSISLCSEQNTSSSLSPPSPLQTIHGGWGPSQPSHNFSSGETLIQSSIKGMKENGLQLAEI